MSRRAGPLAAEATRNARMIPTFVLVFVTLVLRASASAEVTSESHGRELLIWGKHYCTYDCYAKGGYCSAQADCYGNWERGNCGNLWLTWCGCCLPDYSSSSSQEGTDSTDLNFNAVGEEEGYEYDEPEPEPESSLTFLNREREEPEGEQDSSLSAEEGEASEEGPQQQTQREDQVAPSNSTDSSTTQEIAPIVQQQQEEVLEGETPNINSTETAGNETIVNGTTNTNTTTPELNTVVLTLPPESTNLDISMLIDALNEGLLSNEDITLRPGEKEGEFIAIIGPTTSNSFFLNVTDLLQMLGPDATIDIDCEGEGCEVSQEIESEFRRDVPTVLEVKTGRDRRRLLSQELTIRQAQSSQDELVEIKLGCGPQVLRTNIGDGNQTFELNIVLEGPGITQCVEEPVDEDESGIDVAQSELNFVAPQAPEVVESTAEAPSNSNLKIILPVAVVVGVAGIGCLAYGTIVLLHRRKKSWGMSDNLSPPRSPTTLENGDPYDDFGGGISSKLAENESAIHSFGRRTERHDPRFSTPKLLNNSQVVTSLGNSTGQATSYFNNPYNNTFEDSSLIQVSNPGRNELAVAEQVVLEEAQEIDGESTAEKEKKKRKGIKRWFPINLEANSLRKGKEPMKMSPDKPSDKSTPARRSLVDTFQSMDTNVGGTSSIFSSPEVQQSFKVIQQLIDEDDVE